MIYFGNPLLELSDYNGLKESLNKENAILSLTGCTDAGMAYLVNSLSDGFKYKIIVTFSAIRAKEIYEDYKCFDRNVILYPAKDFIFYNADVHGNLMTEERLMAVKAMIERPNVTIITTIDGLMDRVLPLHYIRENILVFHTGQEIDLEECKRKFISMGYERMGQVESPGQFAIRGSIIDIFPLTEDVPYRIDLWDTEIDLIKSFDPMSQRTTAKLDEIKIYPATELVLPEDRIQKGIIKIKKDATSCENKFRKAMKNEEAHRIKTTVNEVIEQLNIGITGLSFDSYVQYFYDDTVSLLDYFENNSVIFFDEPNRAAEHARAVEMEFRESMIHRLEKGYVLPKQADVIFDYKKILAVMNKRRVVLMTMLDQKLGDFVVKDVYHINMRNVNPYNKSFETLVKDLKLYKKNGYRTLILAASRTRGSRIVKDLLDYDINAFYSDDKNRELMPGEIGVAYGNIHKGFEYPMVKFVVITESDIFGVEKKKKRKRKTYSGEKIGSFNDLAIGDYVVHENHGVGVYKGIEKLNVEKVTKDFLKIEYADGGNLYVPATGFDMVQKYAGADARKPKLNKLGSKEWTKTKTRVKGAVADVAKDLVELYASRQNQQGFIYSSDTIWQKEFEEMFPYDETDDQLSAIEAIKNDMESSKIMDRLICGDVGYGKTEVAIRAAFKAVQDGKQVAILAPTTILAQQHYNTLVQRLNDFPVTVDLLCRFRTPAQQKNTINDLKKGFVDILIGTHRILSKDVIFKDLGLLIVDEEQRFGVTHKEKIKQLKNTIDVITLTATPIPRTLHMSLVGIRDMSVLEEPPVDRLPIQTYVMEYNEEMIREAINRELARGGQVYYVYNRVNNIEEIALRVAKLVPDANVAYAHGQMSERRLEQIMYDFINGNIDVLVSTTIIETGMDISNANTMIIHDADRLGLSQMYQLRGRVGRSSRTSYAFLMYKRDKMLKEVAEKRLSAIKEFTELGAGFKIAMRDLEIRGAGNLLGTSQHGHMEAVGYDLYCKMLNEAVAGLKGETVREDFETAIDLTVDAYIPGNYIGNESQKLEVYKRIAGIETEEERLDMEDELADRFGEPTKQVNNLLMVALIKAMANRVYITDIKGDRLKVRFMFKEDANVNINKIPELIGKHKRNLKFTPVGKPMIEYIIPKESKDEQSYLECLRNLLEDMQCLVENNEIEEGE